MDKSNYEMTSVIPLEDNLDNIKKLQGEALNAGIDIISSALDLNHKDIQVSDIKEIVVLGMEFVENHTKVKGKIKEKLVVTITEEIINKFVADPTLKELLLTITDSIVGDMIQLIVDASKGKLDLNKSKIKKMFKCCKSTRGVA